MRCFLQLKTFSFIIPFSHFISVPLLPSQPLDLCTSLSCLAGSEVCIHLKSPLTRASKFNFYESFSCIRPFPQSPISSGEHSPSTSSKPRGKPQRAHTEESHKVTDADDLYSPEQATMRRFHSIGIEVPLLLRATKDALKGQSLAENKAEAILTTLDSTFPPPHPSSLSCTKVSQLRSLQSHQHQHFQSTAQRNDDTTTTKVGSLCHSVSTDLASKVNTSEPSASSLKSPFYRRFTSSWPISLNNYG